MPPKVRRKPNQRKWTRVILERKQKSNKVPRHSDPVSHARSKRRRTGASRSPD
ncbi:unnamed protein product [Musa hybrid cultivar]